MVGDSYQGGDKDPWANTFEYSEVDDTPLRVIFDPGEQIGNSERLTPYKIACKFFEERLVTILDNIHESNSTDDLRGYLNTVALPVLARLGIFIKKISIILMSPDNMSLKEDKEHLLTGISNIQEKIDLIIINSNPQAPASEYLKVTLIQLFDGLGSNLEDLLPRYCSFCGVARRVAGDSFVCEKCGSTDFKTQEYVDGGGNGGDDPDTKEPDSGEEGPADGGGEDNGGSGARETSEPTPSAGPHSAEKSMPDSDSPETELSDEERNNFKQKIDDLQIRINQCLKEIHEVGIGDVEGIAKDVQSLMELMLDKSFDLSAKFYRYQETRRNEFRSTAVIFYVSEFIDYLEATQKGLYEMLTRLLAKPV